MIKKYINNNIEKQIQDTQDFLNSRYKELDDILNSKTQINDDYIDYLTNDIEKMEKEIKILKNKIKNNKHNEILIENKDTFSNNANNINLNSKDDSIKNNEYILETIINNMVEEMDQKTKLIKKELDIIIKNDNKKQNIIIDLKKDINSINSKTYLFKHNFYD